MSIEFSNAYQEVLLENIDVILKQNFVMQTKLKLFEREANIRAELQAKIEELTVEHQKALEQINQTQHYKIQAENNDSIVQEKSRIQSALNETMRELSVTKNSLDVKEKEFSELEKNIKLKEEEIQKMKSRISEFEKNILTPKANNKKVTVKPIEIVENSAVKTNDIIVKDGGTF